MIPDRRTAEEELRIAGERHPGGWVDHSRHVAEAAEAIARHCPGMDSERVYVLGLLHDIGRRYGVSAARHTVDRYDYAMSRGWDGVARVCLTHSFPVQDADADIGKKDMAPERVCFLSDISQASAMTSTISSSSCDALGEAGGLCILEKRFVDVTRRYGIFPFTVDRWNATFAIKEEFERLSGAPLYSLLPGIEACLYR